MDIDEPGIMNEWLNCLFRHIIGALVYNDQLETWMPVGEHGFDRSLYLLPSVAGTNDNRDCRVIRLQRTIYRRRP
jgi:hypothetical protein